MHSRLANAVLKDGNGYGFDGPWRYESQKQTATRAAIRILRDWIDGKEKEPDYHDAIYCLMDFYGDAVKPACKYLWAASLIYEEEERLVYYDTGMDKLMRFFRRNPGA